MAANTRSSRDVEAVARDLLRDHPARTDPLEEEEEAKKGGTMTHDLRMWLVPILAIVLGLLLYTSSKDKWVTIGGYVFVCGFFIVLWLLSGGSVR
jgi:hypothetical protein